MATLWAGMLTGAAFACLILALREVVVLVPAVSNWIAEVVAPLERAGAEGYVPNAGELRRLAAVGVAALAMVAAVVVGRWPALLVALFAPVVVGAVVRARRNRYRQRVEGGLPIFALALADAIAAGRSVREALGVAASGLEGAVAVEAARMAADLEAGSPTALALTEMRRRVASPRLDSFGAAIIAGSSSGADLAGLLRHLAAAESERLHNRQQARAATAQARLTGTIVVALPAGAALLAQLVAPGFVAGMLANGPATAMLVVAGAMQLAGFVLIRKLAGDGGP